MSGRPHRDESSCPPARDLFLSSVLFCAAAAATFMALRMMFGGRPYIGPRRMYIGPMLEVVAALCLVPSLLSVTVESQRRAIDWTRWRLGNQVRTTVAGPIEVR